MFKTINKNRNFYFLVYFAFAFLFLVSNIYANTCSTLKNLLLSEQHNFIIDDLIYEENRFGFDVMYDYSVSGLTNANESDTYLPYLRDIDGYLIIKNIVADSPFDLLEFDLLPSDRLVSINGKSLIDISDQEFDEILSNNDQLDFEFQLVSEDFDGSYYIRDGYEETYGIVSANIRTGSVRSLPSIYTSVVPLDLINVNTKENLFTLKYQTFAEYNIKVENHVSPNLKEFINNNINFFCVFPSSSSQSLFELYDLPDPLLQIGNKIEEIQTYENILYVFNYEEEPFELTFINKQIKTAEIQEIYDLRLYPFDTQYLYEDYSIYYGSREIDHYPEIYFSDQLYHKENFLTNYFTPGFDLIDLEYDSDIENFSFKNSKDKYGFQIEVKRQSEYYVAKILIPIFLIILLSWSSFWIKNDELEAKLTITIVCFLTLIAYNFVVDSDLPKLHYLTWLDYYILSSYIFTGLTTFSAVYDYVSFRNNKSTSTTFSHSLRASGLIIFGTVNLLSFYIFKYQAVLFT